MKGFSIIALTVLTLFVIFGCDDQSENKPVADQTEPQEKSSATNEKPRSEMTEEEKIMADMTEMIERLAEGDKTAFFENEFTYYQVEKPLSEYWKLRKVYLYEYDTLKGITFDSVNIMGDSAHVWAKIIYEPKAGTNTFKHDYDFWMYKLTGDKWIKPYISVAGSFREIEYLDNLRRYQEDAGE